MYALRPQRALRQLTLMGLLATCLILVACGGGGGAPADEPLQARTGAAEVLARVGDVHFLDALLPPAAAATTEDAQVFAIAAARDAGVDQADEAPAPAALEPGIEGELAISPERTAPPVEVEAVASSAETITEGKSAQQAAGAGASRTSGQGQQTLPTGAGGETTPLPAAAGSGGNSTAAAPDLFVPERLAQEDWVRLRASLANPEAGGAASRWVASQQRLVDRWAAQHRERADLVGGWIHDYVDPQSGVPLTWTEESPEPPASADPKLNLLRQAWVTHMRQRNIAYTQTAARLFRATGQRAYADWAMQQLDFYAENYARWPLRTDDGRARMFRNGLSEAVNVFALLDAARLLADAAGVARAQAWVTQLFRPMAENLKASAYPMNNVGLWHQAAVAAIGMRLRDEELVQYALGNPQGLRAIISAGLTPEGIWIEGSFAYNAYVIECLGKLLVQASIEGYGDRFAPEWAVARRLLLSPFDFGFDDGWLPRPGDATEALRTVTEASHFQLFRLLPTYWGLQRANASPSWDALLDPPATLPADAPPVPVAGTRDFPNVRMAVLRAGSWQAFVHYGQATSSHAQEEALNFELYHGATPLSTDSGTVIYSSPFHTRYFRRAAAHNVPMVDGEGQSRWRLGSVLAFDQTAARLQVTQPDYNPRATVEREYRVHNAGFVETTRISLKDVKGIMAAPARLGGAFHTDCTVESLNGTSAAPGQALPASDAMTFWTVQGRYSAGPSWSARLRCGTARYELRVSASAAQRVFVATAPTTPLPRRRNVLYYDTLATGTSFRTEVTALP